jgi:hypothetical protein
MTNPAIFRKVKKFFAGENVETKDAMRDRVCTESAARVAFSRRGFAKR